MKLSNNKLIKTEYKYFVTLLNLGNATWHSLCTNVTGGGKYSYGVQANTTPGYLFNRLPTYETMEITLTDSKINIDIVKEKCKALINNGYFVIGWSKIED